jgi:AraC family transcriptional regulator
MKAIDNALWFIESHFSSPITLDEMASAVGLSRFQLSRAFALATGRSFTAHLRGRRLTEAAYALAEGAPDIFSVALDVGYGSHEAFSRAFRSQFGLTPEEVRERRSIDSLELVEAVTMPIAQTAEISAPILSKKDSFLLAGMRRYFAYEDRGGIPMLWQHFAPQLGHIGGEIKGATYGVCIEPTGDKAEEGFDYFASVAVQSLDDLPQDLLGMRIPACTWAIFHHPDHVSSLATTCAAAAEWLAREGYAPAGGTVQMIEFYGPQFDPRTGSGGCDIWMPIRE